MAIVQIAAAIGGAFSIDVQTFPIAVLVFETAEADLLAGRTVNLNQGLVIHSYDLTVCHHEFHTGIHLHNRRATHMNTLRQIVGNSLIGKGDRSIVFVIPIIVNDNHIFGVVRVGITSSKTVNLAVSVQRNRIASAFLNSIVLESGEDTLPAEINTFGCRIDDVTMFHGKFTFHIHHFGIATTIDEVDILKLVIVAFGSHFYTSPRTRILVVGRACEGNGVVGSAYHAQAGILFDYNITVRTREHDGSARFDGQKGIAFDVAITFDNVIDPGRVVGPSCISIDGIRDSNGVIGAATTTARSIAECSDKVFIAFHHDLTRIVGIAVVPAVEVITLRRNSRDCCSLAVFVGAAAGNRAPRIIVRLHRNGVAFLTARHGEYHHKGQQSNSKKFFHIY